MRFNKAELACLAAHPSHQFDKEGVLLLKERHDGFFRRTEVSTERWCRLRGNLLFYFKSRDHWSEPAGVIVLENFQVTLDKCTEAPFAFNLVFEGGTQHCGALCQGERDAWIAAIQQASFTHMRQQVEALQQEVASRHSSLPADIHHHRLNTGITLEFAPGSVCSMTGVPRPPVDVNEPPFLEICVSCDNLRCDGDGRPPNPRVCVQVLNPPQSAWLQYAQTEVIETTSNPNFLSTVSFRKSDGLDSQTQVRLMVYDVRERVTNTTTQLGQATISLGDLLETGRSRLSLLSPAGRNVGFITISAWTLEAESVDASSHTPSNATPHHQPAPPPVACHRRTQSLPPRLSSKTRHPTQGHLSLLFDNPTMATFRFHSGLGGDIAVLEVMAESRYCFLFPQLMLRLWISEERRWQEELSSLGDLSDQWHTRQMALLNQHVTLINIYNMALDTLDASAHSGSSFKKSLHKGDSSLEMCPTNLHLQRLWAQNESLRRSGFYDIITCGIFTAFSQGYKKGGLVNMLQKAKSSRRTPGGGDKAWASEAAVEGIKRLRQEVVTLLRSLLVALRQNDTETPKTLTALLTKLQDKTRSLLNVIEPSLVEEAFEFLDQIRVPQNPSRILTLATRTYSNYNISGYLSPETALDLELMSPDLPYLPTCGNPEHRQGDAERTSSGISVKDIDIMDVQENSSIYRPTDEPEPWDLIQLNVQASIMCLTSKIKTYCSRMNESREKAMSESVSGELQNELQSKESNGKDLGQSDNLMNSANDGTNPAQSQDCVTEAQNISSSFAAQSQAMISSSVGSDSSHTSGKSMSSSLGVARTNESQMSSCSATPDVSPCEEDSGIGLERVTSEVERTDCISDEGLSVDDERREELLPLDKTEVKRGEKEEHTVNSDVRYGAESTLIKSGKLESIMEQSIEDLGPSLEGEVKSSQMSSDDGILCSENGTVNEKESGMTDGNLNGSRECNGEEIDKSQNSKDDTKDESKGKEGSETATSSDKLKREGSSTPEEVDWVAEVRPSMKKLRQAMDGLMRTARLVHSVFRLQQTPEAAQQAHNIKYRRDICFSQALTSLVTALMTRLWCRKADPLFVTVLAHLGPLAEFECLVSCHGNDEGMLGDMVVAVEDLGTVEFVMVSAAGPQNGSRTRSEGATPPQVSYELPMPHVSGNRCGLRVVLPVPEHVYSLLPNTNSQQPNDPPSFCITPVLFNIGINEEATLAEKLGTDGPQTRNNQDSYERLSQYYHRFKKLPLPQESSRRVPSMGSEVPLVDLIDKLGVEVMSSRSKNPAVLYLAAQCCRAMAGLRFSSCKSGKDRTGMSATLEQASILAAEYDLAETEFQRALNCMRSEGTRLENCQKNIGSRRYAFSAINLTMFPKQYRPPSGTYGSSLT